MKLTTMNRKVLATILATLAIASLAAALPPVKKEIRGVDGFDSIKTPQLAEFSQHIRDFNNKLLKKYQTERDLKDNLTKIIDLAEAELSSTSCLGSLVAGLRKCRKDDSKTQALELFISLENTGCKCDRESFEILAKNELVQTDVEMRYMQSHFTRSVLDYYRAGHAKCCRPLTKQKFVEEAKNVPSEVVEQLDVAFSGLTIYDFGYPGENNYMGDTMTPFDMVGMDQPIMLDHSCERARTKIADHLKRAYFSKMGLTEPLELSESKNVLDEKLFKPCEIYREKLATSLDEARFDAAARDVKDQDEFIHGDRGFFRALINNRLCKSFLQEREKLYEPMTDALNKALGLVQ